MSTAGSCLPRARFDTPDRPCPCRNRGCTRPGGDGGRPSPRRRPRTRGSTHLCDQRRSHPGDRCAVVGVLRTEDCNPQRAGLIVALVSVVSLPLIWLGAPFAIAPAAIALGKRGGGASQQRRSRSAYWYYCSQRLPTSSRRSTRSPKGEPPFGRGAAARPDRIPRSGDRNRRQRERRVQRHLEAGDACGIRRHVPRASSPVPGAFQTPG